MGYQESLVKITPSFQFPALIGAIQDNMESGWYDAGCLDIPTVIVLKKEISTPMHNTGRHHCLQPEEQLLWITGDRFAHDEESLLGPFKEKVLWAPTCKLHFIPLEELFFPDSKMLKGIDFSTLDQPSENGCLVRYPFHYFVNHPELYKKES